MALYVRYLMLVGHEVEVTVTRHGPNYRAVLRVFVSGPGSAVAHESCTERVAADEADRVAQREATEWLTARQAEAESQEPPASRPST